VKRKGTLKTSQKLKSLIDVKQATRLILEIMNNYDQHCTVSAIIAASPFVG
jgi:hypothetical protein